ncbi:MAG: hypothetical protein V9G98_21155 [Candidatus Competibacter sp.]
MTSPELCTAWMQALARPFADTVSIYERQHKIHSDLVGLVSEWVPRIMATLVSTRLSEDASQKEALDVEAVLAQQCFRLFALLLRTAVTTHPATYDENVLDRYLPDIIEIADIIATRKRKELHNG